MSRTPIGVPRKEPPSWTSGAKVVERSIASSGFTMSDAQTAVNALQSWRVYRFHGKSALGSAAGSRRQQGTEGSRR